jgi:hypothetical protein
MRSNAPLAASRSPRFVVRANSVSIFHSFSIRCHSSSAFEFNKVLPAVIPHFYPVFMQRSILLRLQPLLDNAAARLPIAGRDTTEM